MQRQSIISSLWARFPRDFRLFFETPREYLFSFTYPTDKFIHIYPYDPAVTRVGTRLVKKIQKKFPELAVFFHGSAALKIAGQRDVDIIIDCDPSKFKNYLPFLISLLGKPEKKRKNFIQWSTTIQDSNVETLLVSPRYKLRNHLLRIFKTLRDNKKLLKEYEAMKRKGEGLSVREYDRLRLDFFNRVERRFRNTS